MYYAFIENEKIIGIGQYPSTDKINVDISEEVFNNIEEYVWDGTNIVLNPNFECEQAQQREKEFKSQFFEIVNIGFYRRQPKGYSSALESVNTAFNAVSIMGNLPAGTLTFYKEPDYSDPTQCTEEWLVENSFKNEEMTTAEFGQFYASFITAWNTQEHL